MKANKSFHPLFWCLYNFGSAVFAASILLIYFPLWLTLDKQATAISYSLSLGGSMLFAAAAMPVLGYFCDRLQKKLLFLAIFSLSFIIFTAGLPYFNNKILILIIFALSNLAYQLASIAYNALLPQVAKRKNLYSVSGYGACCGYLGIILGIIAMHYLAASYGRAAVFLPTAVTVLIFTLPALLIIKDPPAPLVPFRELAPEGIIADIKNTLKEIKADAYLKNFFEICFLFLTALIPLAFFLGIYASEVIRMTSDEIIYLLTSAASAAALGAFLAIRLCHFFEGPYLALNFLLKIWALIVFFIALSINHPMFWILILIGGFALGATLPVARGLFIQLSNPKKIAELFGLLGLLSKISALSGILLWGVIAQIFCFMGIARYRIAALFMLSLIIFAGNKFYKMRNLQYAQTT